jgi:mannan endo-1,4-beta-mannosidase
VVRTWAFCDGESQWNALQPRPGAYSETAFTALDWVVAEAGRRGLRLLLPLINYWPDYGGTRQYVAWSREAQGAPHSSLDAASADDFYRDPRCQAWYAAHVEAVLTRVNTITGVAYRDDPWILGWAPANEPQCRADPGARQGTLAEWAADAAALLKRLDRNHLVFMDCEGFVGCSTPDSAACNPYDCAATGCDFARDCGGAAVDVACCHLYPDLWLPHADEAARLEFALRWLDTHVAMCSTLDKPLCLTEFGCRKAPAGEEGGASGARAGQYAAVLAAALRHMREGAPLAGTAFWMAAAESYPDYDGFTIYLARGGGDPTVRVIQRHAAEVRALMTNRRDVVAEEEQEEDGSSGAAGGGGAAGGCAGCRAQ